MAKSNQWKELTVSTPIQEYPILIGRGLLHDKSVLQPFVQGRQILIVSNERIAPLYLSLVQKIFKDYSCDVLILPDGEQFKNQDSLNQIYNILIHNHHHRDTTLIALGGGVIGDMVGFAAATYQRGVNFIQIPTSLLAQVDASVGGKTAINHPLAKNMIGSFYQPVAVVIDIDTLKTLPEREFRAGLAEVIKYGLLVGGEFWLSLIQLSQQNINANSLELANIIERCCAIKADFVAQDEREKGIRAHLNLGHTFAHALEAMTKYERWLHGEAVGIGLYCAALLSCQLGNISEADLNLIDQVLSGFKIPRRIPQDIDLEVLMRFMQHDKKILNHHLRFVVMKQIGVAEVNAHITDERLRVVLHTAVEGDN